MDKKKITIIIGCVLVVLTVVVIYFISVNKVSNDEKKQSDNIVSEVENLCDYKENSDGTWISNDIIYKNKVELTGILSGSDKNTVYTVLTNDMTITFEEVAKSFYSSNSNEQLDPKRACVVKMIVTE
jgi:predicted small secreted protein